MRLKWPRRPRSAAPAAPPVADAYHRWFYDSMVWDSITWAGVKVLKSPMDLWNYQEILFVVEFGTRCGGGTLYCPGASRGGQAS